MGIISEKLQFGKLEKGPRDLITDVMGLRVGHFTVSAGDIQTGVTVLMPGLDSAFRNKYPAAVDVINGFGKSTGLLQIEETGSLESPIMFTNTFSIPAVQQALLGYMLRTNPESGSSESTVNTVVTECNDGYLNDIKKMIIRPQDAIRAMANAKAEFAEGAVGAGRGMKCFGLKGGIGSASRVFEIYGKRYTLGAFVLANFGSPGELTVAGRRVSAAEEADGPDKGSCITVIATDMPLSSHQLKRCARRAQNGLARTGSYTGEGSGDITIMFSTANRIPHKDPGRITRVEYISDRCLDTVFEAVRDTVEESVISCLLHAESVTGRDGRTLKSLKDVDEYYKDILF